MLFKKKPLPIVVFSGITAKVIKGGSSYYWEFTYRDIAFSTEDHILEIPNTVTLDKYLSWIDDNKNKIHESASEVLERWGGVADAARIGGITILGDNKISVLIVGDDDWGDMGGDFVFENGDIVDEGWGD